MGKRSEGSAGDDADQPVVIPVEGLERLVEVLRADGRTVVGPTCRDGVIVLDELESADELPFGWGVDLRPGGYRAVSRADGAAFAHSAGPQSWKPFLHRPRVKLSDIDRDADGLSVREHQEPAPRYAFLGVRACDLRAIAIQDRVLTGGRYASPDYQARRDGAFIVVVECTEPGATCFCASMNTGPGAESGFDLRLDELTGEGGHRFVAVAGSEAGREVLARLGGRPAEVADVARARREVDEAADRMGRAMPDLDLRDLMAGTLDARRWDDVAERCLSCGNCTMVCPTCFCTTVTDVSDVSGEHAERWQLWDSCFDLDYSHLHGGNVRASAPSRYRQWLTHKVGTWHDQFGESGCVGCGRCIVWCPVGIDITEEAAALAEERATNEEPPR